MQQHLIFSGSVARAAKFFKGGSDSSVFSNDFPLIILERESSLLMFLPILNRFKL